MVTTVTRGSVGVTPPCETLYKTYTPLSPCTHVPSPLPTYIFLLHAHYQFVFVVYICLLVVDGFPVTLISVGILAHLFFGSLLTTFPVISLLSPGFIGGTCASDDTVHHIRSLLWVAKCDSNGFSTCIVEVHWAL